jgi:hypothetical protein
MDENLTRHADSRIHGSAAVLGKGSNPFMVRDRIPGFHTDFTVSIHDSRELRPRGVGAFTQDGMTAIRI